ncbi:PCD23 protein, partial [Alcedo cyanopectus]|nr:PCD23 protein [Ceyx cyanopectus]
KDDDDDGCAHFEIDSLTGDLFLSRELDYETASHFLLQVMIRDYTDNPAQNSTVFLSIDVEDQNDHAPCFPDDFLVIGIEENVPVGTLLYTFNAKDADGSFLNSKIQYSLETKSTGENLFLLHPSHGTLSTAFPLDREVSGSVILTVSAADQAVNLSDRRRDSLAVKVVLLDTNDNSPSFTSSPHSCVMEDVEVGSLVHHITAKDPDEGRNGQVSYHILSGNENKAFLLDKSTGLLSTAQPLDRESQQQYSLTVMALDDGSPALSTTQLLTVSVLDVNDETPVFLKQLYEATVHENQDPGVFVTKVEAVDRDAGLNSLLRYEILPGNGYEKFKMNSESGVLVTAASLDRETQEVFSIKGKSCHDLGSPSRSSTAQLHLIVLDDNDHSPLFAKTQYQISVREDLEEGSAILDLSASDKDDGLNGEVFYSLIDDTFGAFAINSVTGAIITAKALDQETKAQYTFRAVASDCSSHLPRSSTVSVVVHVGDVNDNNPIFLQNPVMAFVPPETPVNQAVAAVRAEDEDLGSNGAVVFSLVTAEAAFRVDAQTGDIILQQPLASKLFSTQLLVTASDQGSPPQTATAVVIIFTEEQEEEISFSHSLYEASVPENSAAGGH